MPLKLAQENPIVESAGRGEERRRPASTPRASRRRAFVRQHAEGVLALLPTQADDEPRV